MTEVSVIILAAGSSSRMGSPKQLLRWKDETLLGHAIRTAMASKAVHTYVVLGSNEDAHRRAIEKFPVTLVVNKDWAKGMGSSLKAGIRAAAESSGALLVMTCDMPFVTSQHLDNLIGADQDVVASQYNNAAGVPALFRRNLFNELLSIDDTAGAKKIIEKYRTAAALVHLDMPTDLDTPEDYQKALSAD
jgi:molybdenum cofactor cytidylyltransferase